MKNFNGSKLAKAALVTAMSGLTLTQAQASVNVQLFTPSSGNRYSYTENAAPDRPDGEVVGAYRRYMLGVNYSFLHDPLVALNEARTQRVATLISGIQTMDVMGGLDLSGKGSINFGLPLHVVSRPGQAAAFTLGDMRLFSKIYMWHGQLPFDRVLIPELKLPTGSQDLFVSDGAVSAGRRLGAEYDFGVVSAATNIGYRRSFGGAQYQAMNYQNQIPMKLGVSIPVGPRWAINGEAQGILMVPWDRYQLPSEFYVGGRYRVTGDMVASLGASVGSGNAISSSDFRILAGLKFSPTSKDLPVRVVQAQKPLPRVEFTTKAVVIREEVRFEHNSDVLTSSGKNLLDEVAKVLKANQGAYRQIVIEGHTNEMGSQQYNLILSRKRANSVKVYLASRGIEQRVLVPIGYGKVRPKSLGMELSHAARLEVDRRVEFRVIAPTSQSQTQNVRRLKSGEARRI